MRRGCRKVALAGVRQHDDDRFAAVAALPGQLQGGADRSARRNADQQPFACGQQTRRADGLLVGDGHHPVDQCGIEVFGDEAGADALNLVGTGLAAREHGGRGRFDGHKADLRIQLAQPAPGAAERAARADAGHKQVDPSVGVAPYLVARRAVVPLGVGRIAELSKDHGSGNLPAQGLGPCNGPLHPFVSGREDHPGSVGGHQAAPLDAHRLGHGQDQPIALQGADQRQPHAGISARGFDDRTAGAERGAGFGLLDHGQGNPVLDASGRIERFDFGHDTGLGPGFAAEADELHHRGVADEAEHGICNFFHCLNSVSGQAKRGSRKPAAPFAYRVR